MGRCIPGVSSMGCMPVVSGMGCMPVVGGCRPGHCDCGAVLHIFSLTYWRSPRRSAVNVGPFEVVCEVHESAVGEVVATLRGARGPVGEGEVGEGVQPHPATLVPGVGGADPPRLHAHHGLVHEGDAGLGRRGMR
jgi:hypothetical protein